MTNMYFVMCKDDNAFDLFVEANNPGQAYDLWVAWLKTMEEIEISTDNYRVMLVPALTGTAHYLQWYSHIALQEEG